MLSCYCRAGGGQSRRSAMQCFRFASWDKERDKEELQVPARSQSARSNSSISTDHDARRSGSECCSLTVSSEISVESFGRYRQLSLPQRPNNDLRIFTFQELKSATRSFSRALMIGEGGFGCVYRGTIRSTLEPHRSLDVAIKQLGRKGLQGHKEWVTEVNFLGVVGHPNLMKLIGYCAEDDERGIQLLLVYEFMPHGSLADHLSTRSPKPASWAMRLRVALDTARGLKYLHEDSEFKIIFRDLKPSNILLDENWKAKLSDFGLARLGPQEGSHVSTAVVGTIGYAAPEYIHTGRLSSKNDIWSYGVVLYELLTGRRPLDRNRPRGEQNLVEWVKPYSSDTKKFETIMDPRLEGNYSMKSAVRIASLANKCLVRHARYRPKMSEVLEMVQKIVDSNDLGTPEHPLISHSKELASDEKKRKGLDLKRRIAGIKAGDGRWLTWHKWTPKLVRTQ
ncbi:serine/threonine-protein kinase PCRK1-like isoform X1 [Triticum dicoccoides]|uniref:serine/threonine-protein kinase PCRK1-like isoform X1 n=2 Tax=Triticum dicoccoides TaxID=85692 RepID=UPI000E7C5714|nr:serine/threonine-protein kinase PCRK1-like isoform X1 [Triticum dicoccoides]